MSFQVWQEHVPRPLCEAIVRNIWLDIRDHGLDPNVIREWNRSQRQFPHLLGMPEITRVREIVSKLIKPTTSAEGELCTPQIVWHMPDRAPEDMQPWPHVDQPPNGKRFTCVAGVALTYWDKDNGGLVLWLPEEHGDPGKKVVAINDLWPGDIILLSPDQEHSPGINRSSDVRVGLYFRWAVDCA